MKFLISLATIVLPLSSQAWVIQLTYPPTQEEEARHVYEQMIGEHHIPAGLVAMRVSSTPCAALRERTKWHLCIDASGNLQEVSADDLFLTETLRIFL